MDEPGGRITLILYGIPMEDSNAHIAVADVPDPDLLVDRRTYRVVDRLDLRRSHVRCRRRRALLRFPLGRRNHEECEYDQDDSGSHHFAPSKVFWADARSTKVFYRSQFRDRAALRAF